MQRKLTFLAYLLLSIDSFAQLAGPGVQYPFVYYTPREGLVNSRVRSIKQDSRGRMLFITFGGLSIYDGAQFINYSRQNGLADDLINDVVEVSPDSFVVATNANKLNTLVKGRVGVYESADSFYPVVNHFLKSADGNWYVTADNGLYLLSNHHFISLPVNKDGRDAGLYLDRIIEWKNYFLMLPWGDRLGGRLIAYDRTKKQVTDIDTAHIVSNVAIDADHHIWEATTSGPRLIDTIALSKGILKLLPPPEKLKAVIGGLSSFVFFDRENNAWFYSKEIIKVSPQYVAQQITAEQGLDAPEITDLFIDREGTVWIATDGNGIIKMRNTNTEVLNRLDQRHISISTLINEHDTIWLFNRTDHAIYRYAAGRFTVFPLPKKFTNIVSLFVVGEKLYLNTGEALLRVSNKDVARTYAQPAIINSIHAPYGLGPGLIDKNGVLIQYIKENDLDFYLYVLKDEKLVMKYRVSSFVDQMTFDRDGRLWMATRDNHILAFGLHPEEPGQYLQLERDYWRQLPQLYPRAIAVDTNNRIWIGTRRGGVYRIEFANGKVESVKAYTTQDGLTDNFVYTLACDNRNTIWVGTQTGLDRIVLKDGRYIIGNVSKNNNFFQTISKIVAERTGTVWALTNGGIILRLAAPAPLTRASPGPDLLITSMRVNNRLVTDSLSDFPFSQNNLSFTVAATSFIDERSIKYSYLLEGSGNHKWSEPLNNPEFNFNNLAPGHYILRVKADFAEAMYPSQTVGYSFTILPPWWATWWFRGGMAVFALALVIAGIRFYYRRKLAKEKVILERQQAIEKERTRIATDMHDDLGAGLSRIKFLSETIGIKKQQQLPFEDDITKIREYSHEMIDKMGEIVWALNEKNDSISDLLSYTRSYTVEYLSQSGVHCTIDSPEILPPGFVSGEFRRNIFLSVKEILHNIVKHSQANTVCVLIRVNPELAISIRDDGIGFDRANIRAYSNGLANIEKRMKDIGGTVEISNEAGTEVRLTVSLPDNVSPEPGV